MTQQRAGERTRVAAAGVVADGRVLMVRRRVREGELSWQFPAGKIEPGESPEETAVRETREETGLTVAPLRSLGERVHPTTGRLMTYTACEVLDGTAHIAAPEELAELAWLTHPDIPRYIPHGVFTPVRDYLNTTLPAQAPYRSAGTAYLRPGAHP